MGAKDRILQFIKHKGISVAKFESLCGLSNGYIRNFKGRFGDEKLNNILKSFPEISKIWLLTGEGEMLIPSKRTIENTVTFMDSDAYVAVEFIDLRASAGELGGASVDNLPDTKIRLVSKRYATDDCLVVRVDGDSMNDGTARSICDGDEILIKREYNLDALPIRKSLFCITSSEGNVIKQITEVNKKEGYIRCHSFNPIFRDYDIELESIYQIFQVLEIVKKRVTLD